MLFCAANSISLVEAHERANNPIIGVDEDYAVVVLQTETAPVIDGVLDDEVWKTAPLLRNFRVAWPERGIPAAHGTLVRILADQRHLYVAFDCSIPSRRAIRSIEHRRDGNTHSEERVQIQLDTLHTHERSTEFILSAGGAKVDRQFGNVRWDGVWDAALQINEKNWTCEIAIELSCLTFNNGQETFGVNFWRYDSATQQMSGWALHNDSPWDPRYLPSLAGLRLLKTKPPERGLIRAFTVLGFDSDVGGVQNNQGADIEYVLTPSLGLRTVIMPDFSEVESAFERIDVAFVEQFVPEQRDFFTQGSEFFDEISRRLFFSRRIKEFDTGLQLTGAAGGFRLGMLGAFDLDDSENHLALQLVRRPSTNSRIVAGYVDVMKPDFYNRSFVFGGAATFGPQRRLKMGGTYFRSFSSDTNRDGAAGTARFGYNDENLGINLKVTKIDEDFDPVDGFNPRNGFHRWDIDVSRMWRAEKDLHWYRSLRLRTSYGRGVRVPEGDFFSRIWSTGVRVRLQNNHLLRFDYKSERHLEEHIQLDPFADRTMSVRYEIGKERLFRWGIGYHWGRVEDSDLGQWDASIDWDSRDGRWRSRFNYGLRQQNFDLQPDRDVHQWDVSISRLLSGEKWMVLRWAQRAGDESLENFSNFSFVFRLKTAKGRRGQELFLILGDPGAREMRTKVMLKYVLPFTF